MGSCSFSPFSAGASSASAGCAMTTPEGALEAMMTSRAMARSIVLLDVKSFILSDVRLRFRQPQWKK